MPIRRQTDPIHLKRIWNAIRTANHHRIPADTAKITKYLQTFDIYTPVQVELYIRQVLNDKLIVPIKKTDPSSPNQIYKIPLQEELTAPEGKDWYCFECHLAGDVNECSKCFRVFHQSCLAVSRKKFETQKATMNFSMQSISQPSAPINSKVGTSSDNNSVTIIDDEDTNKTPNVGNGDLGSSSNMSNVDRRTLLFNETLCSVCNIERIDTTACMEKNEINYLLKFVLHRIRAWLPNTITRTMAAEDQPDWLSDSELTWRANQLFREHTDMSVIEVKLNTDTYTMFADFIADAMTVQHNVAIFHGTESQEYGAAELMVRDTLHDITELRNCVDCYRHSNEKSSVKWFCLPCRIPHELVWAKQKGYPYWPAKVMKVTDTHYDVRFFGGKYERSKLQKNFIKPIDMSKESLMIKPSTAFNKAFEELRYHQKLLNDPVELEKLISESKQKRKSALKQAKPVLPKTPTPKTPKKVTKTPESNKKSGKKLKIISPSKKSSTSSSQDSGFSSSPAPVKRKKSIREELDPTSDKKRKPSSETEANSSGNNVIDISDGEEEDCTEYSYRQNNSTDSFNIDESFEQVSSSTENFSKMLSPRSESGMQPLDQPYSDSVEKMRRKLECLPNKKEIIKCAMDCMQIEIDRITNDHNEHLKRLFESHNQQISETKKKQWCYNCEQDAIYHCCWNTAYCSQTCQQQHWQAEHKKVCRRKR